MKKVILFSVLIGTVNITLSQIITSVPAYPTVKDSIVIYYDATRGDQGLRGYSGRVFTHTGVTIGDNRWQNVIGSWGDDAVQPELTRIDTDLYKLAIGYPHEFYNVDISKEITELCFVFRSEGFEGPSGRAVGGADIFYELYMPGITVVIDTPPINIPFQDPLRSPLFADLNDTLHIRITAASIGTEIDSLYLLVNNQLLSRISDTVLTYDLILNTLNRGMQQLQAVGTDTAGISDTSTFYLMINPSCVESPPPIELIDGINYIDDNTVMLSLFAPYKEFVYVLGDFNDWCIDTTYFMSRHTVNSDSVYYWLKVDDLQPGIEYGFQYLVDGAIRIADPYTTKILDPWNDRYISSETYPGLKAYPDGKTQEAVALIQTDVPEYEWQANDWEKPEKHELIIYELLIRDFIAKHDFKTLIDTLDYLEKLGINAIELMPVTEFEGNSSWGYNPSFYFASDKYYGPSMDFKRFVDACHARDIAVIMDIVLNHSYGQSPLVRLYDHSDHTTAPENPWYNEEHNFTNSAAHWGYDFDHESPATQYFVDRVIRYWVTEYKIDGYRFDFTKGIGNNIKTSSDPWGSNYDADRIRLLKRMADALWATDSSAYVILEHLAVNSEEEVLSNYGMLLWGNMTWNYAQASMGYLSESDFAWGYYGSRGWSKPHLVTYMESHDEERLMYKNLTWGNSAGNYDIRNPVIALQRMKLVNTFFLTLPGPKMIWQFGELGYDVSIDEPCRICEKPILWQYYNDVNRKNLYKTVAALLKLRNENDVFTNPNTSVQMSLNTLTKRILLLGNPNVLVLGNFGVDSVAAVPNFPYGGIWYDYFSGDSIRVHFTTDPIPLAPGEFHIYTTEKLETPDPDIITGISVNTIETPNEFALSAGYPNPFNARTTLRYDLERESDIVISVYDIKGREVFTRRHAKQAAGSYYFSWEGKNNSAQQLHSGIYFVLLQRKDNRKVRKIALLK